MYGRLSICIHDILLNKTRNPKRASGIEFDEMLFFDDARDGKFGNCEPICKMGVLSVHCPNGLDTVDVFISGLERFKEWDKSPNLIVEWDGSVTDTSVVNTERLTGVVKMVNEYKQYGFVRYRKGRTRDVFFHFRNLAEGIPHIQEGQEVSFHLIRDSNTKKYKAGNIVLEGTVDKEGVQMRCFSMNQPFAALVVNGYKTLETRTGTMFDKYAEGTQMLLHVGRRNYPDEGKHIDVMKSEGMDDAEIAKLKSLPQGYGRGNVVAIVELGKTYEATLEERCNPDFQRKVAAYGADSGRMCTEIKRVSYLKKPIKTQGQGGVFKVRIDPDVIPDGWSIPPNDVSDVYASISG